MKRFLIATLALALTGAATAAPPAFAGEPTRIAVLGTPHLSPR